MLQILGTQTASQDQSHATQIMTFPLSVLRRSLLFTALLVCPSRLASQDTTGAFSNLRVLPRDISRDQLNDAMLDNLLGLGLPRLQGEGCLYCHVGNMEQPRSQWDYASDDKPMKLKARAMMAMVQAINTDFLARLATRIDTGYRVTCQTCHAGRSDPRPLPTVIKAAFAAGGIDSAGATYRALRARYFGRDAYDFRIGALGAVAQELADRGEYDGAVALAALERDAYPDSSLARRSWLRLMMERTLNRDGMDAALAELDRMRPQLGAGVLTPSLLDILGWRVFRQGRQTDALVIIRRNHANYPEEYIPTESLAFMLDETGDRAGALRLLEQWLERHPDHQRARRLLINLRGG
jgi:hypothetical protein